VINELPDLQARIQVALFNILQEGDIQIRGFQFRFPLDIQFVFTANPEDYTNRGSIITPLKDRIQSQIMTHYPQTIDQAKAITSNESRVDEKVSKKITTPELVKDLVEEIAFEARKSEFVDEKSGVSARLSISAYETLISAAERRMLVNKEKNTTVRIADFTAVIPAIIGKIEMVYEGEQEGATKVGQALIRSAIRSQAAHFFPELKDLKKQKSKLTENFVELINWFSSNQLDLMNDSSNEAYEKQLSRIKPLVKVIEMKYPQLPDNGKLLMMEFLLHALAEYSHLSKTPLARSYRFGDLLSSFFSTSKND
jgi:magnesium chelatase subunit I